MKWYTRAADAGSVPALCNLGVCYERGEGVEQDLARAADFYRRAAEQEDAAAQCNLGYLYESGEGVEQSWEEAVRWYQAAADQGYPRPSAIWASAGNSATA